MTSVRLPSHRHDAALVTTAQPSATEVRRARQRQYALLQVARLIAFVLAVTLPLPLWVKLVLLAAAGLLPLMAVVSANSGPPLRRNPGTPSLLPARLESYRVIDSAPAPPKPMTDLRSERQLQQEEVLLGVRGPVGAANQRPT